MTRLQVGLWAVVAIVALGATVVVVCGYSAAEQNAASSAVAELELTDHDVVLCPSRNFQRQEPFCHRELMGWIPAFRGHRGVPIGDISERNYKNRHVVETAHQIQLAEIRMSRSSSTLRRAYPRVHLP